MIKRLRKFRQSKQGAILVMVVLILALAMIFIASAMMLTEATRTRLYKNSVSSQARLTVTTAAEVFLEAIETQEITDAQLDAMLLGTDPDNPQPKQRHTDNAQKIKMVIDDSTVPGMTSSNTNCTYLDLYFPDTNNLNEVYADFTTVIGEDVENVRLKLIVNDQNPSYGGRFSNQIDINADVPKHSLFFREGMGMTTLTGLEDNTVLIRGNTQEEATGSVFYSDFIFTGSAQFKAGDNRYEGNLVFLDGATMKGGASIGGYNGDIYFISRNNSQAAGMDWTAAGGWDNISSSSKIIFAGRTVENNTSAQRHVMDAVQSHSCYFVDTEGKAIASTTVGAHYGSEDYDVDNAASATSYAEGNAVYDEIVKKVPQYYGYEYATGNDPFPSSLVGVLMGYKSAGAVKTIASGSTLEHDEYGVNGTYYPKYNASGEKITYNEELKVLPNPLTQEFPFKNDDGSVDSKYILDMSSSSLAGLASDHVINMNNIDTANSNTTGYYYLTTDGYSVSTNDKKPYLILIDGSKTPHYRFYFEGGKNFDLWSVCFVIYNVDDEYTPTIFILEEGAELHFGGANTRDTGALCSSGIISINRDVDNDPSNDNNATKNANQIASYILNGPRVCVRTDSGSTYNTNEAKTWSTSHKNLANNVIQYSKYYDGKKQPAAYVFGRGTSGVYVNSSAICEAYIGLYEGGVFGGDVNMLENKAPTYLYGRVEASKISMGNSNGAYCMPYCPKPKTDDSKPIKRTAGSKYAIKDIIYYYDVAAPEEDEG